MHEPTRNPVRIYSSDHDSQFPEGSIILTEHGFPLIKQADGWTRSRGHQVPMSISEGTEYRVLYVPEPPPVKVGDELHGKWDTDALPDYAVVVAIDGQVYQRLWGVWCKPGSDQHLTHPSRFPVMLLWLRIAGK